MLTKTETPAATTETRLAASPAGGQRTTTPPQPPPQPPGPGELDLMLRVTPSMAWPILMMLITAVVIALVWSVVSHAPLRADGNGILLTPLGVADIPAPAQGAVVELKVKPGQRVKAGDVVAILSQDDLNAKLEQRLLELAKIRDQENLVRSFYQADESQRSQLIATHEESLKNRIRVLEELEKSIAAQGEVQQTLLGRGLTVQEKLLTARTRLKEVQSEAAEARVTLTRLKTDEAQQQSRIGRELLDFEARRSSVERDIATIRDELRRKTRVIAPRDGIISEVAANIGESWQGPMMRMLPLEETESGTLIGELYVRPEDGKKIRPGMVAEIIPSTVRVQRDGYILGRVIDVSVIPTTREGMMRTLKNSSLVDKLMAHGPPFEVTVSLERAPTSSGYKWSSGPGPQIDITNGTLIHGRIEVSSIPILALAIPDAERVLRRIGL